MSCATMSMLTNDVSKTKNKYQFLNNDFDNFSADISLLKLSNSPKKKKKLPKNP